MDFKDKVVIVTGGNSGIGEAVVRKFLEQDAIVVINYYEHPEKAEDLKAAFPGKTIELYHASITDMDEVKKMYDAVNEKFNRIDILINNAGVAVKEFNITCKESDWDRIVDTNLNGIYNTTKLVIPYMIDKKYGKIINISSVAAVSAVMTCSTAYSATKAGIIGFTQVVAKEVIKFGINVNTLSPGFVNTNMLHLFTEDELKQVIAKIPAKKCAEPEEIAGAVLFLASDEASYFVGANIIMDGGISI